MTLTPRTAFTDDASRAAAGGSFVINLCTVAAPITIPQPRSAQLARFRFFLSYSREGSRKRYGLHMGYFPTLEEAEKWLMILRRIYPQAEVSGGPAGHIDMLSDTQALAILKQTPP